MVNPTHQINRFSYNPVYPDREKNKTETKETQEVWTAPFIQPKELLNYTDKRLETYSYETIVEMEGRLMVLEEIFDEPSSSRYVLGKRTLSEVLLDFAKEAYTIPDTEKLNALLARKDFAEQLPEFMKSLSFADNRGEPHLYGLPVRVLIAIAKVASPLGLIDPLQINPVSGKNLFAHVAASLHPEFLEQLIELFPNLFVLNAPSIIEELIAQRQDIIFVQNIMARFEKMGGILEYRDLWLQIAQKVQPDQKFHEDFDKLSTEHKKLLYQSAFAYNNTFVYEPAAVSVAPDQYSINLIWLNQEKIPEDQKLLFGKGETEEAQSQDFHERFVKPVSAWAEKNPGSSINIWVDGTLATAGAIARSRQALERALAGKECGAIAFRNIRDIQMVNDYPLVFSPFLPIYFRVDLARAITADYVLRQKETQFYVYGDLDMIPLSGHQLFDQRTIDFLDESGFVMAKGGHHGFENGFQILNGAHLQFLNCHREKIISCNLKQADRSPKAIREQQVYDSYPAMWEHLQSRTNKGKTPTKPVKLPPSHFCAAQR